MTARGRRWLWWTGGALAAILLAVALVVVAAPWAVRQAATAWGESLTGRPVAAGEVRVWLREGRVELDDVVVKDAGDGEPLLGIARLVLDLRWRPLLGGRVRVERLEIREPVVRIVRTPRGTSLDDVVAHVRRQPAAEETTDLEVERLLLGGGRVVFTDQDVTPTRIWEAHGISAELQELATRGAPRGTGSIVARLADGEVRLDAEQIGLGPLRARAEVRATALSLDGIAAYVPADAALRPVAGRLGTHVRATLDPRGLGLDGRTTLESLELLRPGQAEPFAVVPRVTVAADGVRIAGGEALAARHVEIDGSARILDTRSTGTRPLPLSRVHGILQNVTVGTGRPARVDLDVALPEDGALRAHGTATLEPFSTDLTVVVAGAPAAPLAAYVPASSAVEVRGGRLDSKLSVQYATASGLRVAGEVHAADFALHRRDTGQPFLRHRRLDVTVRNLSLQDGALTLKRLTLSGQPTFIDHSVSPPERYDITTASGTVADFSWPARGPARVQASARLATGGRSTLDARVTPSPLDVTARIRFEDLDAARLNAYLPAASPVRVAHGTGAADIRLTHSAGGPIALTSTVTLAGLAIATGEEAAVVEDPQVRLTATVAIDPAGTVLVERAAVDGAPTVAGVGLGALHVETQAVRWPATAAAPLRATVQLPGSGTLEAGGTLHPDGGDLALDVTLRDGALGPWVPLLGITEPAAGRLDATLAIAGNVRRPDTLTLTGETAAREVRLGEGDPAPIRIRRATATGLAVSRERVHVDAVGLEAPAGVVLRDADGRFPILATLGVRADERASEATPPPAGNEPGERTRPPAVDIGRVTLEGGYARFVDRTTTPPFTQELRQITATVSDLDTGRPDPARVELDAIVGDGGALRLAGSVAPFAEPFMLDVTGTLSDFRVPGTNPYLRDTFGWVARRGRLSTEVHYRVEGDRLDATNKLLVENLAVRRASGEVDPRIGLPLGLIVSLLKNARGDIAVSLPVTGDLTRPEFKFGDALAAALRQLVGKLVTGPFRAIGRALRDDDAGEIADLRVDPVRFPDGSARLTPESREHLGRVAEFLQSTPQVGIALRPVVTRDDLQALRREAAVARAQRYEREHALENLDAAARALAGAPPDAPVDGVLDTLAAREPLPVDAAQRLAAARTAETREALAAASADALARVQTGAAAIERDDAEGGRVEIELAPHGAGDEG